MTPTIRLLPNFGAEDERPLSVVDASLCEALARTWALLFDERVAIEGGTPAAPSWVSRASAAFSFLDDGDGVVPWLSTEEALVFAQRRGLPLHGAAPAVVRRVSDKAWALALAREHGLLPSLLAETATALSSAELEGPGARALVDERLLAWPEEARRSFTLKPRLGSSGRGRVKGRGGRLDDAGARGLARLARRGGAVLEPWLERVEDLSAQLHVDEDGEVHLVGTTRQLAAPSGVWLGNAVYVDDDGTLSSGSRWEEALRRVARLVGERAAAEGYRGPLGIDAFAYRDAAGAIEWRPLVEVNARFTMGLVACGLARRALDTGDARARQVVTFRARADEEPPPDTRALALPAGRLEISSSV